MDPPGEPAAQEVRKTSNNDAPSSSNDQATPENPPVNKENAESKMERPIFRAQLANQKVLEGSDVTLEAQYGGDVGEVKWFKDGKYLKTLNDRTVFSTPYVGTLQLKIRNAELGDSGLYVVELFEKVTQSMKDKNAAPKVLASVACSAKVVVCSQESMEKEEQESPNIDEKPSDKSPSLNTSSEKSAPEGESWRYPASDQLNSSFLVDHSSVPRHGAYKQSEDPGDDDYSLDIAKPLRKLANFVYNLYASAVRIDPFRNTAISPLLVESSILCMLSGADEETTKEILRTLGLDQSSNVDDVLKLASWYKRDSFKADVADFDSFSIGLINVNEKQVQKWFFERLEILRSRQSIVARSDLTGIEIEANRLIDRLTNGRRSDYFSASSFDQTTSTVCASGVFFRPSWIPTSDLSKRQNDSRPFWVTDDGRSIDTRSFTLYCQASLLRQQHFDAVSIALDRTKSTQLIVLHPRFGEDSKAAEPGTTNLAKLEAILGGKELLKVATDMAEYGVHKKILVEFPYYNFDEDMDLEKVLLSMGLTRMFDHGQCKFTGYGKSDRNQRISAIRQSVSMNFGFGSETFDKAKCDEIMREVDLKFTDSMTFDRPFMYFMFDTLTHAIILIGRCVRVE